MERNEYISDEKVVQRANAAVRIALEKKKATETPIVIYDRNTKNIYELQPNGTKIIVGSRRTEGRYSERNKK